MFGRKQVRGFEIRRLGAAIGQAATRFGKRFTLSRAGGVALVFGLSALAHVFLAHRGAASFAAPATFIIAVIISLCCTAAYGLGIRAFYLAIHADPVGLPGAGAGQRQ